MTPRRYYFHKFSYAVVATRFGHYAHLQIDLLASMRWYSCYYEDGRIYDVDSMVYARGVESGEGRSASYTKAF